MAKRWKYIELRIPIGATQPASGTKFYFPNDDDVRLVYSLKVLSGPVDAGGNPYFAVAGTSLAGTYGFLMTLLDGSFTRIKDTPLKGYQDVAEGFSNCHKNFTPPLKINWTKSYVVYTGSALVFTLNSINIIPFMFYYE